MMWFALLLRVVGVGVILAGAAHVLLPRQLGWTTERLGGSALGDLVVRMHVGFVGLFLIIIGVMTIVAAPDVTAGSPVVAALGAGAALLFAIRGWCEFALVRRVLASDSRLAPWWRWLHRGALAIWPFLAVVYGATAWLSVR